MDWMRCSRLARALFSCPEYVLMTYHFLASMGATDPFATTRSVDYPSRARLTRDVPDEVEHADVGGGDDHRDDDHHGGLGEFLTRRPGDLAHLDAHFTQEAHRPAARQGRGAGDAGLVVFGAAAGLAGAFAVVFVVVVLAIVLRVPFFGRLAGQEGFEPPTSGFGDRRSTVGATALRSSSDRISDTPTQGDPVPYFVSLWTVCEPHHLQNLLELEPLGVVPLVLHGRVVAALALLARHRHSYPHYFTTS